MDLDEQLEDSDASLRLTGRLMEIHKESKLLTVSYDERLVQLLREIRQLHELDPKLSAQIPQKIKRVALEAEK